jgi:dipeptidyl aminopeptidase/acylaminoacyl peptidase
VAEQLGGVDRPQPNGELYAIDADGSNGRMLFGYRGQDGVGSHLKRVEKRFAAAWPIALLPDDPRHILVQVRSWGSSQKQLAQIERLDVNTGQSSKVGVGPPGATGFLADASGAVRVAWGNDAELDDVVYVRAGTDGAWQLWNDSGESGVRMLPAQFARDGQHVYMQVSARGKPDGLYRVDLASRKQELLYQGGADPLELLRTADRKDAYGVVTADGRTAVAVFDRASAEGSMTLALEKAFPGQFAAFTSFSRDGKFGLVRVQGDRNAGDWYLFDMAKKNADYIASPRTWLDPEAMAAMRPVQIKARDGVVLHGYLTLPPGSDGRGLPLVVNPHGGPHGVRDTWGFDPETQFLASRGYAVLQVNFRGSGGYGVDFLTSGYGQWGRAMQDDITDATRWAIAEGHADPKRICIYGASYGGYAALSGVEREPDLYRCAIGYVGVYDLPMMYSRGDVPRSLYGTEYLDMVLGGNTQELRTRSPVAGADRIKAAVMLVAGGRDERVPIAQAKAMRDALDEHHHPYEWLVKDSEGHGFYDTANQVEFYTRLAAFLDRHIGRGAGTQASAP